MSEFNTALDKSVPGLKALIQGSLKFRLARDSSTASKRDWWLATSKAVQSIIIERMIATQAVHHNKNVKRVYYLSLEFLMGRLFSNSLYSAGVYRRDGARAPGARLDYEDAASRGIRHGPRQRRPRPARRLFPRFAGDARSPGDRLRHPLPVRAVQAGVPQRPPGRAARRVDAIRHAVGNRPAGARDRNPGLRPRGERLRRSRQLRPALDGSEEDRRRAVRHSDSGLSAPTR